MNSRWQANKIGLINFWYYDEQEFPFVKGRMLLRGSNGSGKSVTMQSVVPLLLDGDMSPERLDPFRSRDRKMSSYLLEEEDKREERTGYLYLEFRREESETYLTIGMGIRARKGKPLDKWYFSLSDGRRIGRDFFLYKQTDEKITLSKKELENRIQNGGQIFDKQTDYMEYVNRQIFGFETIEEYKELIDLLIQLRTPKLSKDFRPSIVSDILSDSLQPLSDDDLRPLSEAIENMDARNMNLKTLIEGRQAAEKINRVLDKYNRLTLFEKAESYEENGKLLAALEQEAKENEHSLRNCTVRAAELEKEKTELDAKKEAMEKERDSLNKSNAVELKAREVELGVQIADKQRTIKEKEEQLAIKQQAYREVKLKQKEEQDKEYEKQQELCSLLNEMQEEAEDMAFEEHSFFSTELKEHFKEPYHFDTHLQQFEKVQQGIGEGLAILGRVDGQQRQAEELYSLRVKKQQETDAAERKISELEELLVQLQNEWKEKLYLWSGKNKELLLESEQLRDLARFVENYNEESDFSKARLLVADARIVKKGELDLKTQSNKIKLQECKTEREQWLKELAEWENHKEPEPPRSKGVIKNRERLKALGIPFCELYKVLEFGQALEKTDCDRLEEALFAMGILDALVVEEKYRKQVLAADTGCCDKYLFAGKQQAESSLLDVLDFNDSVTLTECLNRQRNTGLLDVLDLNDSVTDRFENQRIVQILGNISYNKDGITSISSSGTYTLGILTGTITKEYEAGFLGRKAREKNRQAKIAACQEAALALDIQITELEQALQILEKQKNQLAAEYEAFPDDRDLQEACRMLKETNGCVEQLKKEGVRLEEQLKEGKDKLQALKKEALQIAEKLYLDCSYKVFQRADAAARAYERHFYQLKSGHELYLQTADHLAELAERIKDLDADMEQLRYDLGNTERALKKNQEEYQSVKEQLALTNYMQIKERLDACIEWLNAYPKRLQNCVAEYTKQQSQANLLREQLERGEKRQRDISAQKEYWRECYLEECKLGYIAISEELYKDVVKVKNFLSPDCKDLEKEAVVRDLNRIYFENRAALNDYQLTQIELFTELDRKMQHSGSVVRRMDIQARYKGVKIPFHKLLSHLKEDIAELEKLLRMSDRELFEDILSNTVGRKIRSKINGSNAWVEKMNVLMGAMNTSSGLRLSLRWRSKTAEQEDQLDTKELVELLKKDYHLMREEEAEKLSLHFRSKVEEARRHAKDGGMISFYQVMKETLDYRKWFEFQLLFQKGGERQKELTNSMFGTFSGGEKAMAMYVPLFSAVAAKYQGGREDAPRLISLDEAFAGVDNKNIRDMFRLMTEFRFNFIINSQVLWGDCDTLDALAVYQLLRPGNAKFVTVMPYLWNGKARELLENEEDVEKKGLAGNGFST